MRDWRQGEIAADLPVFWRTAAGSLASLDEPTASRCRYVSVTNGNSYFHWPRITGAVMFRFIGPILQLLAGITATACPASLILFSTIVLLQTANAAIMYGDFSDIPPGAVMYLDVEESSFSEPVPPPLYGRPTIVANLLDFDPSAFGASSLDGAAKRTDGQLTFKISTIPGTGLTGFSIIESGDFQFAGMQADSWDTGIRCHGRHGQHPRCRRAHVTQSHTGRCDAVVHVHLRRCVSHHNTVALVAHHVCGFGVGHLVSLRQGGYEARNGH